MTEYTEVHWVARKRMVPNIYSNDADGSVWDGAFIVWSGDVPLAEVSDCDGIGEVQAEVNANLIAAAPDLLYALEEILLNETKLYNDMATVIEAKAAIAKAKGETE